MKIAYVSRGLGSRLLGPFLLLGLIVGVFAWAADETPPDMTFDPRKMGKAADEQVIVSPYDRFIALDALLAGKKIDWRGYFLKTGVDAPNPLPSDQEVVLPLLMGLRVTDGVMAVKARDAELLNRAAADIEKIAKKLGATDDDLKSAREARTAANAGEWPKVFLKLGYLQKEIMGLIDKKDNKSRGTLILIGGWLQGARYVTSLIKDNYTPQASNYLREPVLVRALIEQLDNLPEPQRSSPIIPKLKASLNGLLGIIDITLDGSIPADQIDKANALATDVVKICVTPDKP